MSAKIENQIHTYSQSEPMSTEEIDHLRSSSRARQERKQNRLLTGATIGILAIVGALEVQYHRNMPPLRTVNETVQPKDLENPSLVAGRAELEYGRDPGEFNIQQEALRIAHKYGQLYTGEHIQVQVR